ncbi:hypothetical protein BXT86_01500, partial [candidate division WOR-3 bacterium 4484_100]
YYQASNIWHWDEVSNTIVKVNSPSIYYPGEWWIASGTADPGAWRMPADQPQLVYDPANLNDLYCLWLGNDDYTDTSANGYFNGEIYGAYSSDNGLTWSDYVNLTNTRTPGGASGECDDEDYMTAFPQVVNDTIYVTYIEDKDSGSYPHGEGTWTVNPVRFWAIYKGDIQGVAEHKTKQRVNTSLSLYPNPVSGVVGSGDVSISLFDVTGREVKTIVDGYRTAGTYKANLKADDLANGTYFVVLKTAKTKVSHSLVVIN